MVIMSAPEIDVTESPARYITQKSVNVAFLYCVTLDNLNFKPRLQESSSPESGERNLADVSFELSL